MYKELKIRHRKNTEIYHVQYQEMRYSDDLKCSHKNFVSSMINYFWILNESDFVGKFPMQLKEMFDTGNIEKSIYDNILDGYEEYIKEKFEQNKQMKVNTKYYF